MITSAKKRVEIFNKIQSNVTNKNSAKSFNLSIALLVLFSICFLGTLIIRYRLLFLASSDIGGIESNVIYSIQRYMAGYALYANPEVTPYSITQYSPLYYRVVAAFGFLCKIEPENALGVYRLSRIISLTANILYTVLFFKLSNRLYPGTVTSVIVSLCAFVLLPPQTFSRPDSIYILLVITTLYTGLRSIQSTLNAEHLRWLSTTIVVTALAISTKQSGIVLPFILAAYYAFFQREWLKSLYIFLSVFVITILLLISLMPEHDPIILYKNIVIGVSQSSDWTSFKVNIIDHFFRTFTLHNALGLPLCIWLIRHAKSGYQWLGWFTLLLFGFSLATSLKSGSALNYFTEYIALTGLSISLWVRQQFMTVHYWTSTSSLILFSFGFWSVIPNIPNFNWPIALHKNALSEGPYLQQKEVADYLKDSLYLKPTDNVFITNHNYCFLNGLLFRNCLMPQQEIALLMYPGKKINYSAFDKDISMRSIRFLITRPKETTTVFHKLTTTHFRLKRKFPQFYVYESM